MWLQIVSIAPDPSQTIFLIAIIAYSCSNILIEIANQTDIDFYASCTDFSEDILFFIDHNFTGPFELPKIKTVPEISSGYLGPELRGSDREDDGVTSVSMPDLLNVTSGGVLFGYIKNLTNISFP
jgi:hypothetical protein